MKINVESFLILLIIYKTPNFANDYDLLRILERKFKLFDPRELILDLVNDKLIIKDSDSKISTYAITTSGKESYSNNVASFERILLEKYNEEIDFLKILFARPTGPSSPKSEP